MLEQEVLIQGVKEKGQSDPRIEGIWMYGSFTQGCGDAYSDVEFYVFVQDGALAALDTERWIAEVHPIYTHFINEFGTEVVVFKNMVRGEFHFHTASEMQMIDGYRGAIYEPDIGAMCLYDKSGALYTHLQALRGPDPTPIEEKAQFAVDNMINNLLFGSAVLKRGEIARSYELLWYVQRYYLQLIRIVTKGMAHWLNPTKALEQEVTTGYYNAYVRCTAQFSAQSIHNAYAAALNNLREIIPQLNAQGAALQDYTALLAELDAYIA